MSAQTVFRFKPAISSLARQTIKTAFDELDRTISPVDSKDFHATTLQHVRNAALEIESQLAARESLRNMRRLMPLFQGLEHYAKVVDVLCNGTPYMAWIWAPITLILRVASEYVEAFELIMKGYSKIAESLIRFEILDSAFVNNRGFQETLAVFYADILQFHKFAYTFVRRSSWRLLFLTSWGRFQRRFQSIVEDLEHHGALIDKEANARHIAASHQQWQETSTWREENEQRLTQQEKEQAVKQYHYIASWLKADDSEQLTIQGLAFSDGQYTQSCIWVESNQKLATWLRQDVQSCLCWLQGIPGSGKTVLLTQILESIKSDTRTVVSHFLDKSYPSSTNYDQILRSILLQLLRKDQDLTAYVYNSYVMTKKQATTSTLEKLVKTIFTSTSHEPRATSFIWVVLDGFEACELNKQASLISLINQLASKNHLSGGTVCKFLIASRSSPTLSKRLGKHQVISLSEEKQSLDNSIRAFATHKLDSLGDKFAQLYLDREEIGHIQEVIAKKADGMFLYARLILDYIERKIFFSKDEVMKSVNDLPHKLSEFYQQIIGQIIASLDRESVERVRSLLGWIAFAKRPLKRLELLSAVTFRYSNHLDSHLVPDHILTVCGTIVEERPDATLAFIHSTVNEFLQSAASNLFLNQKDSIEEHGAAAIACLLAGIRVFLGNSTELEKNMRVVRGLHGFHLYANEHWVTYLLDAIKTSFNTIDETPLYSLARSLAVAANENEEHLLEKDGKIINDLDEVVKHIPDIQLQQLVRVTIASRSAKSLEQQLLLPNDEDKNSKKKVNLVPRTSLQVAVTTYQDIVNFLLAQHDYPGVSSEELQRFKHQFRNSAFTCRLGNCPYATLGFESEITRDDHELSHSKPIMCSSPNCQYPPFASLRAMERHMDKVHSLTSTRSPIRRPKTLSKKALNFMSESTAHVPSIGNHAPIPALGFEEPAGNVPPSQSSQQSVPARMSPRGLASQMTPQDRQRLQHVAMTKYNSLTETEKNAYRAAATQRINPQQMHALQSKGQDPVLFLIQQSYMSQWIQRNMSPNNGMDPSQIRAEQQMQQQPWKT